MADLYRKLEELAPTPAEVGKWVYGKRLTPPADGRIPVGTPGGLATLNESGKLRAEQVPSLGGFVPTYVPAGESFLVPLHTQALFVLPITLDAGATLIVEGALLEITA